MKKLALVPMIVASLSLSAAADVTKEDITKLVKAGVSDNVVLSYIQKHGPVDKLSATDLIELKEAQVSEAVLKALMQSHASRPGSSNASPVSKEEDRKKEDSALKATYAYTQPNYYRSSYGHHYPSYTYPHSYYGHRYRSYHHPYYGHRRHSYGYVGRPYGYGHRTYGYRHGYRR